VATYRYFAGNPSLTALTGSSGTQFICGITGEHRTAPWLTAYWWYVPATGSTAPQTFCAWCMTSGTAGTLIAASVATSGTLTAGQWNRIPLASPIPLAPNTPYIFQTGFTIGTTFANQSGYFNGGGTDPAGITVNNGLGQVAIIAYGDSTDGGTNGNPLGASQALFLVGSGTDPTAHMANEAGSGANFGMDAEFSDVMPASYTGNLELYPNSVVANHSATLDLNVNYNVGTVYQQGRQPVLGVRFFSGAGASGLPTKISIWSVSSLSRTEVLANTSPSWSGAVGSGWVTALFPGSPVLPAGEYVACAYNSNGTVTGGWNMKDSITGAFGAAGPLSAGITMGTLYAPPLATSALCYDYNGSATGATPPYNAGTTEAGQCVFGQAPDGSEGAPWLYAGAPSGSNPQNYFISPLLGQPVAGGWSLPLMQTVMTQ
jgi:hypothetical protein